MAPKTIRQALANMLEDLKPEDLKKFCTRLVDRRKEPRVRRNRLKTHMDYPQNLVPVAASHNRFPGAVYGVNGECVPVHAIINYLDGQHCRSLRGKPKLFFIQACGGGEKDSGSPSEVEPSVGGADDQMNNIPMSSSSDSLSMSAETDFRDALPTQSDILVSYCTSPGCVPQRGSLYVETLDHILEKNAATLDLVKMLTKVKKEVPEKTAHFLRKSIYFQTQE
eukprot:superscaffoldBa00005495_g20418